MMLELSIPQNMTRCCTVLIVDDDQNLLTLWATILRPLAHVQTAATLSDGLERIERADILILDWRLDWGHADPILDQWIEGKDGPVVVVSGFLELEARYKLYARGVWNTFQKPIPHETLISIVRRYIRIVRVQNMVNDHSKEISIIKDRYDNEIKKLKRYITVLALAAFGATLGPDIVNILVGLL